MKNLNFAMILVFCMAIPYFAHADLNAKKIASTCAACHGDKGISESPLYPNLAGQKKDYLVKQLKDFRADLRKDPVMTAQAKLLKEEDLESIAKYYSDMKAK